MKARCVIISAAPNPDIDFIKKSVNKDDFIICADAGYEAAFRAGLRPQLIVGDFDSAERPQTDIPVIGLSVHKDDTDTMSAIKEGIKKGYTRFLLLGALGGRIDHTFANFSALAYLSEHGAQAVIKDSQASVYYTAGEPLEFRGKKGQTLSVFPFGCDSCTVTHHGFEYELAHQAITSSFPLGISNVVTSDDAMIEFHDGQALVMLFDGC